MENLITTTTTKKTTLVSLGDPFPGPKGSNDGSWVTGAYVKKCDTLLALILKINANTSTLVKSHFRLTS